MGVTISRMAVETRVFPLYEVEGGDRYRINHEPRGLPVSRYLETQGRFKHLERSEIERIQQHVDAGWDRLLKRVGTEEIRSDAREIRVPEPAHGFI